MATLLISIIYLSFVSLGLPDGVLGAAWPTMCLEFNVPVSYAGAISLTTCTGTIISSLLSDRLTRRFGSGLVTAVSVTLTAIGLMGYSFTRSYSMMFLWAIPYGIGGGGVDAALNNYVAQHYASRHMSWLHCMWGVGASLGPYIMSFALTGGQGWNMGYRYLSYLQLLLTVALYLSIPLWKKREPMAGETSGKGLSIPQILAIPGAKAVLLAFFCYCAVEQTAMLWASTYLVGHWGVSETEAASLASLIFIGITAGRAVNGFLTYKFSDKTLIRLGSAIMGLSIALMILPLGLTGAKIGLVLFGVGCAPVYPCIVHGTPEHFGAENSQAIIGVQMAMAYVGVLAMPPIFGLLANHISIGLLPWYLGSITLVMTLMCEKLNKVS